MTPGPKSRLVHLIAVTGVLLGCGDKAPKPAKGPIEHHERQVEAQKPAPKKAGPDCSDGTCIPCGDAQCPKGFFCDESSAKATCQWVPTCSETATCGCIERALAGKCSCTERDGGAYVRCTDS